MVKLSRAKKFGVEKTNWASQKTHGTRWARYYEETKEGQFWYRQRCTDGLQYLELQQNGLWEYSKRRARMGEAQQKVLLSAETRDARLAWRRQKQLLKVDDWSSFVFSDDCRFKLRNNGATKWEPQFAQGSWESQVKRLQSTYGNFRCAKFQASGVEVHRQQYSYSTIARGHDVEKRDWG